MYGTIVCFHEINCDVLGGHVICENEPLEISHYATIMLSNL